MKAGWVTNKLGDVTTKIGSGATPLGGEEAYKAEGISLIRSLNVYDDAFRKAKLARIDDEQADDLSNVVVEPHDVLLNITGASLARCCLAPPDLLPARVNQHVSIIRPIKEKLDSAFLHYLLVSKTYKDRLLHTGEEGGSTRQAITKAQLQEFVVAYPESLAEQRRIVGILDEAFDGLAIATANAERNLRNARALFESHLESVFTRRGDSPVVPIGDVAEVFDGPHATPKTVDAGPVFLGISALQDGKINLGETRHVTLQDFRQWTRRVKPQSDDVVFSYETRLGQAAIIPEGLECCLGRRMGLVRVNRKRVDPRFFVYQYISPPFRKFVDSKTVRGATVDRIALKEFPSFPISLPSLSEQERMTNRLDKLRAETQRLESICRQKLAALGELKKSLLHQAFSGQL
ncbi:MAG: restriction endonuclease subunit S [Nitrospira sp.]|jgi:type I restriction enzyme S subunit|nr:restriction endonuclease subunit S [Nitrospira sp.]